MKYLKIIVFSLLSSFLNAQGNGIFTTMCGSGCTPVTSSGPIPEISTYPPGGPKYAAAKIIKLENCQAVTMDITSMNGSAIYTEQFSNDNGFNSPIFWYGMTSAGSPAASGNYIVKLTCSNACSTFTLAKIIFTPGNSNNFPSELNPQNVVTSPYINYFDCCEPDIYLSNNTFNVSPDFSPYLWHYRPQNNLFVNSCTIQSNHSKMELIAGSSIEILLTNIEPSADEFGAWIAPCSGANRPMDPEMAQNLIEYISGENQKSHKNQKIDSSEETSEKNILIVPNPSTDGKFELLHLKDLKGVKIKIYSSSGTIIKEINNSKFIDLSSYDKGIYIVEVYSLDQKIIKKIIYQ